MQLFGELFLPAIAEQDAQRRKSEHKCLNEPFQRARVRKIQIVADEQRVFRLAKVRKPCQNVHDQHQGAMIGT